MFVINVIILVVAVWSLVGIFIIHDDVKEIKRLTREIYDSYAI